MYTCFVPDIRLFEKKTSGAMAYLISQLTRRQRSERIETPTEALSVLDRLEKGELTTSQMIPEEKTALAPQLPATESQISGTLLKTVVGDQDLNTKPVFLQPNEVLFYEDDESFECYVLMSGTVKVLKSARCIAVIDEPGSFVGEMSPLIGRMPRTATVVGQDEAVLLRIEEQDFSEFFSRHPDMTLLLAKSLATRLRTTTNDLDDAHQRLSIITHHVEEMTSALRRPL